MNWKSPIRPAACALLLSAAGCTAIPVAPWPAIPAADNPAPLAQIGGAMHLPSSGACRRDWWSPECQGVATAHTEIPTPPAVPAPGPAPADPAQAGRVVLGIAALVLASFAVSFGLGRALSSSLHRIPPISEWPRR
jgi:hypothetical protein